MLLDVLQLHDKGSSSRLHNAAGDVAEVVGEASLRVDVVAHGEYRTVLVMIVLHLSDPSCPIGPNFSRRVAADGSFASFSDSSALQGHLGHRLVPAILDADPAAAKHGGIA